MNLSWKEQFVNCLTCVFERDYTTTEYRKRVHSVGITFISLVVVDTLYLFTYVNFNLFCFKNVVEHCCIKILWVKYCFGFPRIITQHWLVMRPLAFCFAKNFDSWHSCFIQHYISVLSNASWCANDSRSFTI